MGFLKGLALKFLKPFGKSIACGIVQKEGDVLQEKCKIILAKEGPAGIDKVFDGFQAKVMAAVKRITFLPEICAQQVRRIIVDEGDALQEKLKMGVAAQGPEAIDHAFDLAQYSLIERIKSL